MLAVTAVSASRTRSGRRPFSTLVADVGHQRHESGSFDRLGNGVLASCGAAGFSPGDNFSLPIRQLFEEVEILVVDVPSVAGAARQ